jgi:predicted nucleotide-binding protein (sugar kinase/HSP70/actin superfamily)
VEFEADFAFRHKYDPQPLPAAGTLVEDVVATHGLFGFGATQKPVQHLFERSGEEAAAYRRSLRIGIPRVLTNYSLAPFLRAYLETLGIQQHNIVFSEETSERMWLEGGRYGAIDPCYPAKVALAHVHRLLAHPKGHRPFTYIWFPAIYSLSTYVSHTIAATSCPVIAGTPKVVAAALTKEKDLFAAAGVGYVTNVLEFERPTPLERQLLETWGDRLRITAHENAWAIEQGFAAMRACDAELERRGRDILEKAEDEHQVALLVLCRPYHNDPGLNHGVLEEFQALGYPVITIRSIPKDAAWLARWFAEDLANGGIADVFDVRDVWPENYSAASVQKVWAAKFAARHPNVAVLDLSSFKCGNDAPTYSLTDRILAESRTPCLALHDLDANKPGGSIKIRVKTYAYTLALYGEQLVDRRQKERQLREAVAAKRAALIAARPTIPA